MKHWIESHFPEHLDLLKTVAAIPAPSHHEDARVEFLLDHFKKMGVYAYSDAAKNVIVPMGDLSAGGITVFSAHTDVVFPDFEPLPVREENGLLYAPGVGDDTANLTAILTIVRYIRERGLEPKSPVMFVLNSCEEGLGNLKGTRQLMSDLSGRIKELISFDCSFESGMIVKAVGSERWRVLVNAEGGHSFSAFGNSNAIHELSKLIVKLYGQTVPEKAGCRTTYNVGKIEGGTSINTIAQSAEMLYEYRSDDRECLSLMRESFKTLLEEAGSGRASFSAELIGERPCGGEVDEAAYRELKAACAEAIKSVLGGEVRMGKGSTDANIPLSLGVPAVTFGLYSGDGEHTRGEWLRIDSLKPGLEIGLSLVLKRCFGK